MEGSVRKRGDKWYYYFEIGTVDGKRKKIDRVGGATKSEAQLALRMALNAFDSEFIESNQLTVGESTFSRYTNESYSGKTWTFIYEHNL